MTELTALVESAVGKFTPLILSVAKALILLMISWVAIKLGEGILDKFFSLERRETRFNENKMRTITGLLKSVLRYVVYFVAGMNLLELLGINTASLLTAAGIGGLAVGFGAQNLVKDIIAGFFIIFEDQYNVGDYIEVASVTGIVGEIGLRTTTLSAFGGEVHVIPNGEISLVTNYSRDNMRALVRINISYEEDVPKALKTIERACEKVKDQREDIVSGPTVLGITGFEPSHVQVTVIARVLAMKQWDMERQLRLAILESFAEGDLRIPYPKAIILNSEIRDREKSA